MSDEERSARWRHVFIGVWTVAVLVQMFGFGSAEVDEPGWLDLVVVVFLVLAVAAVAGAVRWRPWRYKVASAACGVAVVPSVVDAFLVPWIGYAEAGLWLTMWATVSAIGRRDPMLVAPRGEEAAAGGQGVDPAVLGDEILLRRGIGGRPPKLLLARDQVLIVCPGWFKSSWSVPRDQLLGAAPIGDGPVPEPAWVEPPTTLFVRTGTAFDTPDLSLVFRTPQTLPKLRFGAARSAGLSRGETRRGVRLDSILLATKDHDAAVAAFSHNGVTVYPDPVAALRDVVAVVEDPVEAERILGERNAHRRRTIRKARVFGFFYALLPVLRGMIGGEQLPSFGWLLSRLALVAFVMLIGDRAIRYRRYRLRARRALAPTASPRRLRLPRGGVEWAMAMTAFVLIAVVTRHASHWTAVVSYWLPWGWMAAGLYSLIAPPMDPGDGATIAPS